jgi:hypothetical protein
MSRTGAFFLAMALGAPGCTTERRVGVLVDNMPPSLDADIFDVALPEASAPIDDDAGTGEDDGGAGGGGDAGDAAMPVAHFKRIPAGQPLPSEADCANRVRRGLSEPVPENATFNRVIATAAELSKLATWNDSKGFDNRAAPLGRRITGNFTGTTDEIFQWAACKWGFDENFVRADAYQTNGWHQASVSGWTADAMNCPPNAPTRVGANGTTECAQVFSLFGITWQYHKSSWPMVHESTAFAVDYALGFQRVCFEGYTDYMNGWGPAGKKYGPNDEFGCAASFYTGGWYDYATIQEVNRIRDTLNTKPWPKAM